MNTQTFTYIYRNITGVSYEYADATWFSLSDTNKCRPARAAFIYGRDFMRRKYKTRKWLDI